MAEGEADRVADELWSRVRDMAARVDAMQAAADLDELGPEDQAKLDRLRARLARAAERADLADRLADEVAGLRPTSESEAEDRTLKGA
jgi:hypothetical protein